MFPKIKPAKKIIYLDHAATTPVDPAVLKVMLPFLQKQFGNPSSLYKQGREAAASLEEARKKVAEILHARPSEIIFTAGGTESVNLAIFGALRKAGTLLTGSKPHLVTTAIEHHAVLQSVEALAKEGFSATSVPVDSDGRVHVQELQKAIRPETCLLSVMYANNEIGSIQPIAEIGKWLHKENATRVAGGLPRILFHTDACQAPGSLDLNVNSLGVDLLSLNGSKIYGPKQIGCLYVRTGASVLPVVFGGGQERGLRSGTENVAAIAGFAKALELSQKNAATESKRLSGLRNYLLAGLRKIIPDLQLNGPEPGTLRLPGNINISIPGVEGEALMLYLDAYNIAVSTGSACTSTSTDPSHVLLAIGKTEPQALASLRLTLGKSTTKPELDFVVKLVGQLAKELRKVAK